MSLVYRLLNTSLPALAADESITRWGAAVSSVASGYDLCAADTAVKVHLTNLCVWRPQLDVDWAARSHGEHL